MTFSLLPGGLLITSAFECLPVRHNVDTGVFTGQLRSQAAGAGGNQHRALSIWRRCRSTIDCQEQTRSTQLSVARLNVMI